MFKLRPLYVFQLSEYGVCAHVNVFVIIYETAT